MFRWSKITVIGKKMSTCWWSPHNLFMVLQNQRFDSYGSSSGFTTMTVLKKIRKDRNADFVAPSINCLSFTSVLTFLWSSAVYFVLHLGTLVDVHALLIAQSKMAVIPHLTSETVQVNRYFRIQQRYETELEFCVKKKVDFLIKAMTICSENVGETLYNSVCWMHVVYSLEKQKQYSNLQFVVTLWDQSEIFIPCHEIQH